MGEKDSGGGEEAGRIIADREKGDLGQQLSWPLQNGLPHHVSRELPATKPIPLPTWSDHRRITKDFLVTGSQMEQDPESRRPSRWD